MKQTFCRYVQRPGADEDSNPVSGSGLGNPVGRSLPYGGGGASYLDPGGEAAPSSQDYDHPHHHHHHYHSSAPLAAALACAPSSSGSFILASSLQVGDGMLVHKWWINQWNRKFILNIPIFGSGSYHIFSLETFPYFSFSWIKENRFNSTKILVKHLYEKLWICTNWNCKQRVPFNWFKYVYAGRIRQKRSGSDWSVYIFGTSVSTVPLIKNMLCCLRSPQGPEQQWTVYPALHIIG